MSPVAALHAVEVDYADRRALGPFDLSLAEGEIVALVGPSGCGKSTALRLLAGLEAPMRGGVQRTPGRGETAVVFQAPTLMPWAGAAANVALPLELSGVDKAQARDRAAAALTRVGLGTAVKLKPAQLSGGMAMRVSLARALVTQPKLLLLDEPFAALDEITRRTLADDVLALWAETRPAIVFVTHNVEEAVYMAARIVVMSPSPGRAAGETPVDAPLPRPDAFARPRCSAWPPSGCRRIWSRRCAWGRRHEPSRPCSGALDADRGSAADLGGGVAAPCMFPSIFCPRPRPSARLCRQAAPALMLSAINTLIMALEALTVAAAIAIPLALVSSLSPALGRAVSPIAVVLQVTPVVAIAPLVVIWAGLDHPERAITALAAIVAFFPIFSGAATGLRAADPDLERLFDLYGAGGCKGWRG